MEMKKRASLKEALDIQNLYYDPAYEIQIDMLEKQTIHEMKTRKTYYQPPRKISVDPELTALRSDLTKAKYQQQRYFTQQKRELYDKWTKIREEIERDVADYENGIEEKKTAREM